MVRRRPPCRTAPPARDARAILVACRCSTLDIALVDDLLYLWIYRLYNTAVIEVLAHVAKTCFVLAFKRARILHRVGGIIGGILRADCV